MGVGLGIRNWDRGEESDQELASGKLAKEMGWGVDKRLGRPNPVGVSLPGFSQEGKDPGPDLLPFHADMRPYLLSLSSSPTCHTVLCPPV